MKPSNRLLAFAPVVLLALAWAVLAESPAEDSTPFHPPLRSTARLELVVEGGTVVVDVAFEPKAVDRPRPAAKAQTFELRGAAPDVLGDWPWVFSRALLILEKRLPEGKAVAARVTADTLAHDIAQAHGLDDATRAKVAPYLLSILEAKLDPPRCGPSCTASVLATEVTTDLARMLECEP